MKDLDFPFLWLFGLVSLWCGTGLVIIEPSVIMVFLGLGMIIIPVSLMVWKFISEECEKRDAMIRDSFRTRRESICEPGFGEGKYDYPG